MRCTCCGAAYATTVAYCCAGFTMCGHGIRIACSCGNKQTCWQCDDIDLANQGLSDYAEMLEREDRR